MNSNLSSNVINSILLLVPGCTWPVPQWLYSLWHSCRSSLPFGPAWWGAGNAARAISPLRLYLCSSHVSIASLITDYKLLLRN